jgi:hypothetical protein
MSGTKSRRLITISSQSVTAATSALRGRPSSVPYRVTGASLEILRVYHHARRWPKQL